MYTCRDEAQRKQINAFMTAFQVCEQADAGLDCLMCQALWDMGGTVFMALGFGRGREREAGERGERETRGYEPFALPSTRP